MEGLRARVARFAAERDWDQFHSPRNLLLALTGEVGELCELFQWRGDAGDAGDPRHSAQPQHWTPEDRERLGEELSDVLLYLLRLADRCDVDLSAAALRKLALNAAKYPVSLVRGRSEKYDEYRGGDGQQGQGHAARNGNGNVTVAGNGNGAGGAVAHVAADWAAGAGARAAARARYAEDKRRAAVEKGAAAVAAAAVAPGGNRAHRGGQADSSSSARRKKSRRTKRQHGRGIRGKTPKKER